MKRTDIVARSRSAVNIALKCLSALAGIAVLVAVNSVRAHGTAEYVLTNKGWVKGVETVYGYAYRDVPFAARPERWKPPEEHAGWSGVRDASELGATCAQLPLIPPVSSPSLEEDCLTLNVYRPRETQRGANIEAPVMVWIHGGYNTMGGAIDNPRKLVETGAVVVTVQYRLGVLGFLAHPSLSAESSEGISGNYGLMDQQAALRWVQNNIQRFGGDRNNVTVFGESAGGHNVLAHLISPASRGLFHRAIIQSGSYTLAQPTLAVWEQVGQTVMTAAGCPDGNLTCMRNLSVEALLATQSFAGDIYFTVADAHLLPTTFQQALETGDFNKVPVMTGTTHDESSMVALAEFNAKGRLVTAENYVESLATVGIPLELAQLLATEYYPVSAFPTPSNALGAVLTDRTFACRSLTLAGLLARSVPTFVYEFNDRDAPTTLPDAGYDYGAFHTSELPYIFDLEASPALTDNTEQSALSEQMVSYWSQFASEGDPNSAHTPIWSPYTSAPSEQRIQTLQPAAPGPLSSAAFSADHQCEFWNSVQ